MKQTVTQAERTKKIEHQIPTSKNIHKYELTDDMIFLS